MIQKHIRLFALITLCCISNNTHSLDDATNKTYMFTRPIWNFIGFTQASWHNILYNKQRNGFAAQMSGIYAQSFPSSLSSAYFLFDYNNEIVIQGGSPSTFVVTGPTQFQNVANPAQGQIGVDTLERNMLGQWIGLNDTKTHLLTLNPAQEQAALMIEVSQDLNKLFHNDIFENWFINVSTPLNWVKNNLGIQTDAEVINGFADSNAIYNNFVPGNQKALRLSHVAFSLGTRYMAAETTQLITTSGVLVPLVEQGNNSSLFQPVVGLNAHFGFEVTFHAQFPIVLSDDFENSKLLFFFDIDNIFLARNHQMRTYDIRNKPFSRYMQLYDQESNQLVPAMNILTLRSRVEPFNVVNMATGLRLNFNKAFIEIAYDLWAHGYERITPEADPTNLKATSFPNNQYAIPFIDSNGVLAKIDPGTGNVIPKLPSEQGQSASQSTINYIAAPDGFINCCPTPTFNQQNIYLTRGDLDHTTANSASAIVHTVYLSIGTQHDQRHSKYFVNAAAFLQAVQNNAALCMWGAWIKAGITF